MASHLNTDILREIFEFAGFSDTAAGARLSRVCKQARCWLIPRIYAFLVLDNYAFARLHKAHTVDASSPPFFAPYVRTIAIMNMDCIRAPLDGGPCLRIPPEAYQLDKWWPAPLPSLQIVSCCCMGTVLPERGLTTSISRLYLDSGCDSAMIIDPDVWSEHLPALTHLGLRESAANRKIILRLVNALLYRAPPAVKLEALSLRLHTPAPKLSTTGIWKALQALRDGRILVGQTSDTVYDLPPWNSTEGKGKVIFDRTHDIFLKYVSGVEDPWAFGERVHRNG
ncbi:hypothetical protein EXIGLDRAFT_751292 [Exidia glandulosa HHB12029]|uniref:F-box domain-containing protein n=1 Tax=Exidia glandulosa HHB12029 TaxID=1314781 RepID=A0A165FLZ9_EXIGL|nr:hypothetical protein EXIGLDRAFT_751292 [Exidia glandulosa HHB12029]